MKRALIYTVFKNSRILILKERGESNYACFK